ncbi:MAG: RNA polymerase sigma factor [Anaerolineales bacterium]
MHDPTETALLCAAQEGDMDAFEDLQQRLEGPLTRFVRRLTGAGNVEDDIVQDVFITLYLKLGEIDPPEKLRPYLFRVARNRCYDELRRRQRREWLSLDDEPTQLWVSFQQAHGRAPEDATHWMLLLIEVQEAMDDLPALQRDALILYAEEGFSYAEIAEVMNTSLGTIKSRIYHAKQGLRRRLSPQTLAILTEDL